MNLALAFLIFAQIDIPVQVIDFNIDAPKINLYQNSQKTFTFQLQNHGSNVTSRSTTNTLYYAAHGDSSPSFSFSGKTPYFFDDSMPTADPITTADVQAGTVLTAVYITSNKISDVMSPYTITGYFLGSGLTTNYATIHPEIWWGYNGTAWQSAFIGTNQNVSFSGITANSWTAEFLSPNPTGTVYMLLAFKIGSALYPGTSVTIYNGAVYPSSITAPKSIYEPYCYVASNAVSPIPTNGRCHWQTVTSSVYTAFFMSNNLPVNGHWIYGVGISNHTGNTTFNQGKADILPDPWR